MLKSIKSMVIMRLKHQEHADYAPETSSAWRATLNPIFSVYTWKASVKAYKNWLFFFLPVRKLSNLIDFDGVRNLEPLFSCLSPFNLGTRRCVQEWLIYLVQCGAGRLFIYVALLLFPSLIHTIEFHLAKRFSKTTHFLPQTQQCRLPTYSS